MVNRRGHDEAGFVTQACDFDRNAIYQVKTKEQDDA